ncbi:MAG: ATP synthase F1 subunit delta [Candidatus Calescibacterium sp.]|nr:ATP synthase F1 subunit delta [Candidatus Calescibacterium sp.]
MIAQRYAKSLLLAAKETGNINKILEDIKKIQSIFKDENVRGFILAPLTSKKDKIDFIDSISKKFGFLDITTNFLKILLTKKRFNLIDDIINAFYMYYQKDQGIETVVIVSAEKLSDEQINSLREKLEKAFSKKFEIDLKYDENMLLGMEILGRDWRISLSARNMLREFSKIEF